MPYTLGPLHSGLTGQGSIVVDHPAGLQLVTDDVPSYVGHSGGSPERFFRFCRLAWASPEGFWASVGLEYLQEVIYPLPDMVELVAYDLVEGATLDIRELLGGPPPDLSCTATAGGVTLTADPCDLTAGTRVVHVSWSGFSDVAVGDYVAYMPAGAAPTGWINYYRLSSGTHTPGASAPAAGAFDLTITIAAGSYQWQIQDESTGIPRVTLLFEVT